MQNFLSLWLNAGAQITHGGQVQRPRLFCQFFFFCLKTTKQTYKNSIFEWRHKILTGAVIGKLRIHRVGSQPIKSLDLEVRCP